MISEKIICLACTIQPHIVALSVCIPTINLYFWKRQSAMFILYTFALKTIYIPFRTAEKCSFEKTNS